MAKKKENSINELLKTLWWLIMLLFLCVILLYIINSISTYFVSDDYYCSKNPDKCVCEEYKCTYQKAKVQSKICKNFLVYDDYPNPIKNIECTKFHKKTQAELNIDDCNSNPREDEKCKCEQKRISTICTEEIYFEDCFDYSIGICLDNGVPCNRVYANKDYFRCDLTFNESYTRLKCNNFLLVENVTSCSNGHEECVKWEDVTNGCIQSRPKMDYEKHPENYVAETKEVLNTKYFDNCCTPLNITLSTGNLIYKANKICFEADSNEFGTANGVNLTKCGQTSRFINQTTYRLKNECEKGNPTFELYTKCIECPDNGEVNKSQTFDDGYIFNYTIKWNVNLSNACYCTKYQTTCREKTDIYP